MTEGNYGWAIYGHIRVGAQLKLRGSSHKIFKVAKEQQHELILATKCYGSDSALINPGNFVNKRNYIATQKVCSFLET